LTSVCIPLSGNIFSWPKISAAGRWIGFYFFSSQKSSRGEDSATGQCGGELSTNSHEPLQDKWRRSSDIGAAVSKRCRAALRRPCNSMQHECDIKHPYHARVTLSGDACSLLRNTDQIDHSDTPYWLRQCGDHRHGSRCCRSLCGDRRDMADRASRAAVTDRRFPPPWPVEELHHLVRVIDLASRQVRQQEPVAPVAPA
jgi:hypothetical protein